MSEENNLCYYSNDDGNAYVIVGFQLDSEKFTKWFSQNCIKETNYNNNHFIYKNVLYRLPDEYKDLYVTVRSYEYCDQESRMCVMQSDYYLSMIESHRKTTLSVINNTDLIDKMIKLGSIINEREHTVDDIKIFSVISI
jgi:hypothetical protein